MVTLSYGTSMEDDIDVNGKVAYMDRKWAMIQMRDEFTRYYWEYVIVWVWSLWIGYSAKWDDQTHSFCLCKYYFFEQKEFWKQSAEVVKLWWAKIENNNKMEDTNNSNHREKWFFFHHIMNRDFDYQKWWQY